MNRTRARTDGLSLMRLGVAAFLLLGFAMVKVQRYSPMDFRMAHSCARCLIQQCDPYKQSDVLRMYRAEGGPIPIDQGGIETLRFETLYLYFPSVFTVTLPFAVLPFQLAYLLWVTLIAGSFVLASFLMWNLGAKHAPLLTGAMLSLYLANSASLISSGNPAGVAVSLCVIASWCFLTERFPLAGILCLTVSLALKPHDAGLVWLYFLLAGGAFRKRALQTLGVFALATLPALSWVTRLAPHWLRELQSNMEMLSAPGGVSDPGPATVLTRGTLTITDLQSAISLLWNNEHFYNEISYGISALILAALAFATLRSRPSAQRVWIALAAVSALTMLPVYHRQYDAKLVILTIPACALLWSEDALISRLAVLVTSVGLLFTSDLPWAFFLAFISKLHLSASGLSHYILIALLAVSVPLSLLTVCVFYIWVYVTRCNVQHLQRTTKGVSL
jgi:hypothetical protein